MKTSLINSMKMTHRHLKLSISKKNSNRQTFSTVPTGGKADDKDREGPRAIPTAASSPSWAGAVFLKGESQEHWP